MVCMAVGPYAAATVAIRSGGKWLLPISVERIPTGHGKTEGVLAAWAYHRVHRNQDTWPKRLVWCLPMRVLVEQRRDVAQAIAGRINNSIDESKQLDVHVAMAGEDAEDWFLHPERPAILIGTQDMLLSRALNRGFASTRSVGQSSSGC